MSEEKPSTKVTQEKPTPQPAPSSPTQTKQAKASTVEKTSERGGSAGTLALLLIVITAIAIGGYFGMQLWQKQDAGTNAIRTLTDQLVHQNQALSNLQSSEQALNEKLINRQTEIDALLRQQQVNIDNFVSQINAIRGSTRKDWLLAQAEYLLRIANQRLVIEKDPSTSEALLEAANDVLAEINDPALMPVRIKIAEELLLLRSQARGQIDTLLMRLNAVSNQLASLNLDKKIVSSKTSNATTTQTAQAPEQSNEQNWWQRLVTKLESAFSRAISIQRSEEPHSLPPSPEYSAYLKQNLALRIEQAKLLLMRHRLDAFSTQLGGSIEWARNSFPQNDARIDALLSELLAINEARPHQEDLEISGSLELLRSKIEQKYRDRTLDMRAPADKSNNEDATE